MKVLKIVGQVLSLVFRPIRTNGAFFVFMYVLGVVCAWLTLPANRNAHLYENLYPELLVDVYAVCVVLTLLPVCVRRWTRRVLYVVLYAVAVVDVYCFWKFESTLTPTMLLLVAETDAREMGDFFRSYLSTEVVFGPVGVLLWLIALHAVTTLAVRTPRWLRRLLPERWMQQRGRVDSALDFDNAFWRVAQPLLGALLLVLLIPSIDCSAYNKRATWAMLTSRNIGDVEHMLTQKRHAEFYTPIGRLVFSMYANSLTARQVDQLIAAANEVRVDSCSFTSPNIVLIIGESFGRHHSHQYGYFMPTTPRQERLERSGRLVPFSDVVAPWNLTSYVFKSMFSMHVVGQKGEWCDYPLFPELFRKAGYHVTFLTNQFLPKAKEAVYDFSGGFFLNNPTLSAAQFDTRNDRLHQYDEGLLEDYDRLYKDRRLAFDTADAKGERLKNNLVIFHLLGQHVTYRVRYPKDRARFKGTDYDERRPELNPKQRQTVAEYDNAVRYNDSIVDQICRRFEHQNAIVIYVPDHGEECFEGRRGVVCRLHSTAIDWDLARLEFDVPFWMYCSPSYMHAHPDIYRAIVGAKDRRMMTDVLPHTLVYLAGIAAPDYHAEYDILSPAYQEMRPRILKATTDYDKLRPKK